MAAILSSHSSHAAGWLAVLAGWLAAGVWGEARNTFEADSEF